MLHENTGPRDPGAAATGDASSPRRRVAGPVRETFQRLRLAGLSDTEAAALTAWLTGLQPGGRAWTIAQVERLDFLRVLLASGRLVS